MRPLLFSLPSKKDNFQLIVNPQWLGRDRDLPLADV